METKYIVIGIFILIIISTAIVLIYQIRTSEKTGGVVPFDINGMDKRVINAVVPLTAETAKVLAQRALNNNNFSMGEVSKQSNIWIVSYGCKEDYPKGDAFILCGGKVDINEDTRQIQIYVIS